MPLRIPSFAELPLCPSDPPYSAWGLWGESDQLGCLNHLTPARVKAAAGEIKTGVSIGLSWEMHQMSVPPFYRTKLEHHIFRLGPCINDDKVSFNTQTSSQWDGFRHWSFSDGRLYNGVTQDEVRNGTSTRNGIHEWTKRGIVGRGVLIDYQSYVLSKGLDYDPWSYTQISVSTVEEIAKIQGVSFLPGDILFLRTGFLARYENLPHEDLVKLMGQTTFTYPGLESSVKSLEWLWDSNFAAVAGDNPGFEAWNAGLEESKQFRMHETLLSGFGLPIGELFDLEDLAVQCAKEKRWSFFLTSQPLNVVGGVGSPPNAIAIF